MRVFIIAIVAFLICSCSNPISNISRAKNFIAKGDYVNALLEVDKAIDTEPDSLSYLYLRVKIFDLSGKYKEAILSLTQIIESNKNEKSLLAYHQRAHAYYSLGLYKDALKDVNHFISTVDSNTVLAEAYLTKASILYKLNDTVTARTYYLLTIEENNGQDKRLHSNALVGLGNLANSKTEALSLLNSAIILDSTSALAYGARGALFYQMNKASKGYKDIRTAFELEPISGDANFNLGQVYFYSEKFDSAIVYFENALRLSPQSPRNDGIYLNLAMANYYIGNLYSAESYYEKEEAINPNNDLLYFNFSMFLSELGKDYKALDKISKAIEINKTDADYYNTKGAILLKLLRFKDAEIELLTAIKLDPTLGEAYYNLGYLNGELNNSSRSIKFYDNAVELNFQLESTLVNRAFQKITIKQISSACIDFKAAYKLGREDVLTWINEYCR